MFVHVWPFRDPGAETVASFRFAIDAIPATTKRRFGYGVLDAERAAWEAAEIARLEAYANPRL